MVHLQLHNILDEAKVRSHKTPYGFGSHAQAAEPSVLSEAYSRVHYWSLGGQNYVSCSPRLLEGQRHIYWHTPPQEIYTTNYNAMVERNIQTKENAHVHTSFSITVGGQLLVSEFWCSQILLNRLPQSSNPEGCTPDLERLVFGPLIASPTNWIASWGRVLALPWLIADVELAISWQIIAKNHDFCHEHLKKTWEKSKKS